MLKTRRAVVVSVLVFVLAIGATAVLAGDEHKEEAKEVTLSGEVLDLYCFMQHPDTGQGSEHAKCANSCISRGLPIGYMADGVVYLIIGTDHKSAAEMVAGFAGRPSVITGVVLDHNGVKAIEIMSIKEAKS